MVTQQDLAAGEEAVSRQSIKHYVTRRLVEGASLEVIWPEVRALFPHRCPGWGYLLSIKKQLLMPEPKP
jgi:hypothetical protein